MGLLNNMKGIKGFQKGHKQFNSGRTHFKKGSKMRLGIKAEKHPRWKGGIQLARKRWLEKNPNFQMLAVIRRRARKRNAEGSFTAGEWETLKKQYGFTCPCCKKQESEIHLTVDHIIPLIKGGSNYIENIQPLCRLCNSIKSSKIIKFDY